MSGFDEGERARLKALFVEYRRTDDRALRDQIIESHMALAEHLARRFVNRGIALDDLTQVASLGLVKAVQRFDPDRGLEFSTFATPTIVGELKRHFRDKGWSVRVPRRVQELHFEVSTLVAELTHTLGRSPTIVELASASRASEEEVIEAIEAAAAYRSLSLDAPGGSNAEGMTLGSQLGDEDSELFATENQMFIDRLLVTLPAREQLIVRMRFYEGMTQQQIANRLSISQMHVSRLLANSLRQLRKQVEVEDNA